MAQLNLNLTSDFERDLARLMRLRNIRTKSEAIRFAVHECVERAVGSCCQASFGDWIGLGGGAGEGMPPRFKDDDALWNE